MPDYSGKYTRFTDDEVKQLYKAGFVVVRPDRDIDVAMYRFGEDVIIFDPSWKPTLSIVPKDDWVDVTSYGRIDMPGWESLVDRREFFEGEEKRDVVGDDLDPAVIGATEAWQIAAEQAVDWDVDEDHVDTAIAEVTDLRKHYHQKKRQQMGLNRS